MKNLAYILAGVGAGLTAYLVFNRPGPKYATGLDGIESAAKSTADWGTRKRVTGAGRGLVGKAKGAIARATGNGPLADEGAADQVAASVKKTAGKVAQAAGQTLHDLNR